MASFTNKHEISEQDVLQIISYGCNAEIPDTTGVTILLNNALRFKCKLLYVYFCCICFNLQIFAKSSNLLILKYQTFDKNSIMEQYNIYVRQ